MEFKNEQIDVNAEIHTNSKIMMQILRDVAENIAQDRGEQPDKLSLNTKELLES